jgi:hypothetical protein
MKTEKPERETETPEKPDPVDDATTEGVRQQREHIKELTGEDPLRAGIAD